MSCIEHASETIPVFSIPINSDIPENILNQNNCYIIQGLNLWQFKSNDFHKLLINVNNDKDKILKELCPTSKYESDVGAYLLSENWKEFVFPIDRFKYVMKYFKDIYNTHKTEAVVLLMVNTKTKSWEVLFVLQCGASHGSVIYAPPNIVDPTKIEDNRTKHMMSTIMKNKKSSHKQKDIYDQYHNLFKQGYRLFGTIHSHCDFGAFHSSTDDADEIGFDGLHITIGKVNSGWDFSCRYMLSANEFKIDIKDVLGVESIDKLFDDVDNINIDDYHLELMMPDLVSRNSFAVPSILVSNDKKGRFIPDDNNDDWFRHGLFDNKWDDYNHNVFNDREMVRLYDWHIDEIIFVKRNYFNENRERFDHHSVLQTHESDKDHKYKYDAYIKNLNTSYKDKNKLTILNTKLTNKNYTDNKREQKKIAKILKQKAKKIVR